MTLFLTLLANLIPLYVLIGLGFVAGQYLEVKQTTLANLVLFIFLPVFMFGAVTQMALQPDYALIPFLILALCTAMTLGAMALGRRVFGDSRANLMAMCVSEGNAGYLGLPVVILLFDEQWVGVYMLMVLGNFIYDATGIYYLAARGNFSVRDSLVKIARFPTLYAILAGLAVNMAGMDMPENFYTYWAYFKGCFVVMGMMIIGVALSRIDRLVFGPRFLTLTFIGKFVVWPVLAGLFVLADRAVFHLFDPTVHSLFMIMALMPPAANITAYAAQLDLKPEKAATTVLLGTVFALFFIPFVLVLTGLAN